MLVLELENLLKFHTWYEHWFPWTIDTRPSLRFALEDQG